MNDLVDSHRPTLVEFLRARYDEEEQAAHEAASSDGQHWTRQIIQTGRRRPVHYVVASRDPKVVHSEPALLTATYPEVVSHAALHDPARVLREVEAKRREVDLHGHGPHECVFWDEALGETCTGYDVECPTLRLLALPYADHPDYREEWKP